MYWSNHCAIRSQMVVFRCQGYVRCLRCQDVRCVTLDASDAKVTLFTSSVCYMWTANSKT